VVAEEEYRIVNGAGYPIVVEGSVREPLRAFIRERGIERFVVLCDRNVTEYARSLTRGLKGRIALLPFALSEREKRMRTVEQVLGALVKAGADRTTAILGVGGGVSSDLFGFAASIYMRGVPYIHVATSLVAMVDAAIGGKTGVDLDAGKNLAGTFRDPVAVFAHVDALRTLPYRHLREGLAEMVKHAVIEGGELFESLETLAPHPFWRWSWENIVSDSLQVKVMVVNDDRLEHGIRETLNLGHTFGHAIERVSGYRVSHGAAVSVGLRGSGLLALRTGRFSRDAHLRILTLLMLLKMPLVTREQPDRLFAAMQADKKKRAGRLRFVLPRDIGDVEYGVVVPERKVRAVLNRLSVVPGGDEFR
jgi:3-dehydroquinate synthase